MRTYPVIVKLAPITFDTSSSEDIRAIVQKARIDDNQVTETRWIKDPTKRVSTQKFAFLAVELRSPEAANAFISSGAYIHGKRCEVKKFKADPHRCNRCQRYGHVTSICRSEQPTCGHCAGTHWTSHCDTENKQSFCANCRKSGHGAKDNECIKFSERIQLQDTRNPGRRLKFYPTVEAWTHQLLQQNDTRYLTPNANGTGAHYMETTQ